MVRGDIGGRILIGFECVLGREPLEYFRRRHTRVLKRGEQFPTLSRRDQDILVIDASDKWGDSGHNDESDDVGVIDCFRLIAGVV